MNTSRIETGADALIAAAVHNGVSVCFANPGTTELHVVQAIDRQHGMRAVLCAFEGVCSGAADAFARMTAKPALGLYHLGPGFANALANLHNARRHGSPMINVIGDQASWHRQYDAPLTSNIDLLGDWAGQTRTLTTATDPGRAMADAVGDVVSADPRVVSIVLPSDVAWSPAISTDRPVATVRSLPGPDDAAVRAAADGLTSPGGLLVVGGPELSAAAMRSIGRIRRATGCDVYAVRPGKVEIGARLPRLDEMPYFPGPLERCLHGVKTAVMVGRDEPVTFFGYPDTPSLPLPSDAARVRLCGQFDDVEASLAALADAVGGQHDEAVVLEPLPDVDPGPLSVTNLGTAFLHAIQPNHIVVGEGLTSFGTYRALAAHAAPHTLLGVHGGAIGGGLPAAIGAAVACPDRPVLTMQADGSALYTIQSLWTMAREALDVTVVLAANRRYRILDIELAHHGMELSPNGRSLTDVSGVSFHELAHSFGVPGRRVTTGSELVAALDWAASEPGPHLVEAEID